MPTTWNAIYLGNYWIDLDPFEGDSQSESAIALFGETFGSASDKLAKNIVSVTANDNGGQANALDVDNNLYNDTLDYDLGSGPQSAALDGMGVFNATLTYTDGTTANISAVVFQDTTGNLFLAPEVSANADSAAMEAKAIQSLTINSLITDDVLLTDNRYMTSFVCFTSGTRIRTPDGERLVETLLAGDLVTTLDRGPQVIAWQSSRVLDFRTAPSTQKPIELKPGALGEATPQTALRLSPQHRVFLKDPQLGEVLVPALWLSGYPRVRSVNGARRVTYHTLMFRHHEVIFANGAAVESFFPGDEGFKTLSATQILSLRVTCPWAGAGAMPPARSFPKRRLLRHRTEGAPTGLNWESAQAQLPR